MVDSDGGTILFVHHRDISTPVGTTVPYYVSKGLTDAHAVHVVCRAQPVERDDEPSDAVVRHDIDTGDLPVLSPLAFHVLATLYVAVLCVRLQFDVVYCFQSTLIEGWVGARAGGSKLVAGLQSVPVRQRRNFLDASGRAPNAREYVVLGILSAYASLIGAILERSSEVICLTDGIATTTEDAYGVDLSDAHVIGMGVDIESFAGTRGSGGSADRRVGWTLTYVGHVGESRGFEHVFEAISSTEYDVTLRIAGDGPNEYLEYLSSTAERLGISDRVEWLGLVPHEEVPRLLAETDFAISPLKDIESYRVSFPAKLLEYMAAGTRIVATDIPPHRTLIEDEKNGYLYDGSQDGLAKTFNRMIESDEDGEVGGRAREVAEAYNWDALVERYEAVLFGSASEGRPPPDDPRQCTPMN